MIFGSRKSALGERTGRRGRPGADYDALTPGYLYGYDVANRYRGRHWADIEPDRERGGRGSGHRAGVPGNTDEGRCA